MCGSSKMNDFLQNCQNKIHFINIFNVIFVLVKRTV